MPSNCCSPGLAQHPALETPADLSPMVQRVPQSSQGLAEAEAGAARVKQVRVDKAMDAASGYP